MSLAESFMYLMPHTHVMFENNQAYSRGGAIYIHLAHQCFFKEVFPNSKDTIRVTFINNTAKFAGASIYGEIRDCDHFYDIFNISNTENDPSAIASEPSGSTMKNSWFSRSKIKWKRMFPVKFPEFPGLGNP